MALAFVDWTSPQVQIFFIHRFFIAMRCLLLLLVLANARAQEGSKAADSKVAPTAQQQVDPAAQQRPAMTFMTAAQRGMALQQASRWGRGGASISAVARAG